MNKQEFDEVIRTFALNQSGSFDFDALSEYTAGQMKGFDEDAEDRLYDLACESDYLFEDESVPFSECFVPRHVFFKGAQCRVTPLESEVAGGFLVPGHRFIPFLSRAVFPSEAILRLPDGSVVPMRQVRGSVSEMHRFLMFFGQYGAIEYLLHDSEGNAASLQPPFDGDVLVTVFDFSDFFEQCGFKAGDSLMLEVQDWTKGAFSVGHISRDAEIDFAGTYAWNHALRLGLEEFFLEMELGQDCYEQMARMLWFASVNEDAPPVLQNPPLSLAAFFNMQEDLTVRKEGQISFFWPKDKPIDELVQNAAYDSAEPETELDAFFNLLGISLDSGEAEAYMRDALARGENDSKSVLTRVINGCSLTFPSAADQKQFYQLWDALWDEVRDNYDSRADGHREVRSVFLALNDQCLNVLRELDQNLVDPMAAMSHPANLELAELSALISSVLLFCNCDEADPERFPMPLDEMAREISAAITQLSSELNEGDFRPAKKAASKKKPCGLVYQLKISLKGAKPPIWRRVLVPSDISLANLHDVIQLVFGWSGEHMHQFLDGRTYYLPNQPETSYAGLTLENLMPPQAKEKIRYEYDFGDSWMHDILLEKVLEPVPEQVLPLCIKGAKACPLEDCGGLPGYYHLLETLVGPDCEEKEELLDWVGEVPEPNVFDLDDANAALRAYFGN